MSTTNGVTWVVYRVPVKDQPDGMNAVCQQREWEAMERLRPGYYTFVRGGISSEGEAERLARDTSGDTPGRTGGRTSPFAGNPQPTSRPGAG